MVAGSSPLRTTTHPPRFVSPNRRPREAPVFRGFPALSHVVCIGRRRQSRRDCAHFAQSSLLGDFRHQTMACGELNLAQFCVITAHIRWPSEPPVRRQGSTIHAAWHSRSLLPRNATSYHIGNVVTRGNARSEVPAIAAAPANHGEGSGGASIFPPSIPVVACRPEWLGRCRAPGTPAAGSG